MASPTSITIFVFGIPTRNVIYFCFLSTRKTCFSCPMPIPYFSFLVTITYEVSIGSALSKKVTVDLYSASSRTRIRCTTASRRSALISARQFIQPGTSTTLRDHGYGRVYHAMCLFTVLVFAGYSFQPATKGELRLSRPSAWFCANVICQSKTVTQPCTNRDYLLPEVLNIGTTIRLV